MGLHLTRWQTLNLQLRSIQCANTVHLPMIYVAVADKGADGHIQLRRLSRGRRPSARRHIGLGQRLLSASSFHGQHHDTGDLSVSPLGRLPCWRTRQRRRVFVERNWFSLAGDNAALRLFDQVASLAVMFTGAEDICNSDWTNGRNGVL